jgi:hypothetical protein
MNKDRKARSKTMKLAESNSEITRCNTIDKDEAFRPTDAPAVAAEACCMSELVPSSRETA